MCRDEAPRGRPDNVSRNPITLAREWRGLLAEPGCSSRADLARRLGVTRARVTQVLQLLELAPEMVEAIAQLGDPLTKPVITERALRPLLHLPAEEQQQALARVVHVPQGRG